MNKIITLLTIIAVIATGCKKTKPAISFTDQNKKLVGEWKLDKIASSGTGVNGQSSGGSTTDFYKPTVLKLNINQTASLEGYLLRKDVDTVTYRHVSGNWVASGSELTLTWDGDDVYAPEIQKYDLDYLSKKEMRISFLQSNAGGSGTGLYSNFTFVYTFTK
jgi:hypothetical protein